MYLCTSNIKNSLNPDQVRNALRKLKSSKKCPFAETIYGFQEFRHNADKQVLYEEFSETHHILHIETSTPIAVPKALYDVVETFSIYAHGSVRQVTPARGSVGALLKSRTLEINVFLDVWNGHMVSSAWSKRRVKKKRRRKKLWRLHYQMWRDAIADRMFQNEHVGVVVLGDFNRGTVRPFYQLKWLYNEGIDKIGAISVLGLSFKLKQRGTIDVGSDHLSKYVELYLNVARHYLTQTKFHEPITLTEEPHA